MHSYIHTYKHTHTHTHTYIYIYIHTYIHTCMHTYTYTHWTALKTHHHVNVAYISIKIYQWISTVLPYRQDMTTISYKNDCLNISWNTAYYIHGIPNEKWICNSCWSRREMETSETSLWRLRERWTSDGTVDRWRTCTCLVHATCRHWNQLIIVRPFCVFYCCSQQKTFIAQVFFSKFKHFLVGRCEWYSAHTHTHTHTHSMSFIIYIYIYIYITLKYS